VKAAGRDRSGNGGSNDPSNHHDDEVDRLPPEDQPDVFYVGPVGPIPIIDEDDPRFSEDRAAWSTARAKAQALHSPDELLRGMTDPDWRVRYESVDRLVARGHDDPRTAPILRSVATDDEVWQVRSRATMCLSEFDSEGTRSVLIAGLEDPSPDVRWAAHWVIGLLSDSGGEPMQSAMIHYIRNLPEVVDAEWVDPPKTSLFVGARPHEELRPRRMLRVNGLYLVETVDEPGMWWMGEERADGVVATWGRYESLERAISAL
jgi:HEAT repeat protein